jgi:hypothetical protein
MSFTSGSAWKSFRVVPSPGAWRDADDLSERRRKMTLIGKAASDRDVRDACPGIQQTALGRFNTLNNQVLMRWQPRIRPAHLSPWSMIGGK